MNRKNWCNFKRFTTHFKKFVYRFFKNLTLPCSHSSTSKQSIPSPVNPPGHSSQVPFVHPPQQMSHWSFSNLLFSCFIIFYQPRDIRSRNRRRSNNLHTRHRLPCSCIRRQNSQLGSCRKWRQGANRRRLRPENMAKKWVKNKAL